MANYWPLTGLSWSICARRLMIRSSSTLSPLPIVPLIGYARSRRLFPRIRGIRRHAADLPPLEAHSARRDVATQDRCLETSRTATCMLCGATSGNGFRGRVHASTVALEQHSLASDVYVTGA